MELTKRLIAFIVGFFIGAGAGAVALHSVITKDNFLLQKEIYECAVGLVYEGTPVCLVYSMKGFLSHENPSSGRRNNNNEQGKSIRSEQ